MIRLKASLLALGLLARPAPAYAAAQEAADEQPKPPRQSWSFYGVFGRFDQAQLQRGFQVYREVCSNCHRLSIAFRTLESPDGPGLQRGAGQDAGGELQGHQRRARRHRARCSSARARRPTCSRRRTPSPTIRPPPPRSARRRRTCGCSPSRANTSAASPGSCSTSSPRYQEIGADYIYAILTGYTHKDDPQWNLYYPGHKIAMPMPLQDGAVKYTDGTPGNARQLRQGRRGVPELGGRADA